MIPRRKATHMWILLLPPAWLIAGGIVSIRRHGNSDAPVWKRIGVAVAWPFFLRDFRG